MDESINPESVTTAVNKATDILMEAVNSMKTLCQCLLSSVSSVYTWRRQFLKLVYNSLLVKGIAHVTTSVQSEGFNCLVHLDSISKSDVRKGDQSLFVSCLLCDIFDTKAGNSEF